ncbi:MAG: hypothetical protein ACF8NJ_08135, partial [Phycisphaerales bacterium JB038]
CALPIWQAQLSTQPPGELGREAGLPTDCEHKPHGGGDTHELERLLGQDLLLVSVGWASSYYQSE